MNDVFVQRLASSRRPSGGIVSIIFVGVFGIFWWTLIGAFDYMAIRDLVWQIRSARFIAAPAHIVQSQVTSHRGSKGGTTYGVAFEYKYTVSGSNYVGNRYVFNRASSSDRAWTEEAVAAFPAGTDRVCYYDPQNPARAVLAPGIHGSDLVILMFLTPFNVIGAFFVAFPIWTWRNRRRRAMLAPRVTDALHSRQSYAMKNYNPVVTFIALFGLMSFIGIFAVVFPSGFHPTIAHVLTIWAIAFLIALWGSVHVYLKTESGEYDLVLDYGSRSITVPAMHQRHAREIIPMSEVKEFTTLKVETGSGNNHRITWQVKLIGAENGKHDLLVHESFLETDAKRLADTLNAKLRGPDANGALGTN